MRYRWLLFDLDGTLLDYHAAEQAALRATLADAGLAVDEEVAGEYRRINAGYWAAFERGETDPATIRLDRWRDLLVLYGHDPSAADEVAQRYVANLATGAELVEGATELLAELARTHRLAYLTNGFADVQRPRLAASGLGVHTDVVVISDEVGASKPDPAIFAAAFERMGAPERGQVLMIGDSLTSDIAGGAGYGIDTCWFNPFGLPLEGPVAPTHEITRLAALRELC